MFFESMREEERTSLLTAHFFTNACAMTLGMLISRTLLEFWGAALPSYQSILLLSSLLMLFTLILLARVVSTQFPITPLAVRVLSVRLFSGSLDEPIVASIASARRTASRMRRLKPEAGRRPVTGRRRRPRRTR